MDDLETHYAELSETALKMLHDSARNAYDNDRSLTEQGMILAQQLGSNLSYYGTNMYSDWPLHVNAIEAALTTKDVSFIPITN